MTIYSFFRIWNEFQLCYWICNRYNQYYSSCLSFCQEVMTVISFPYPITTKYCSQCSRTLSLSYCLSITFLANFLIESSSRKEPDQFTTTLLPQIDINFLWVAYFNGSRLATEDIIMKTTKLKDPIARNRMRKLEAVNWS